MKKKCLTIVSLIVVIIAVSCWDNRINTIDKLHKIVATAQPGDTITLVNGTYTDVNIQLQANGKPGKPIVVQAETPGKVFIEGKSNIQLAGEYLVISGLHFRNGYSDKSTIEYRLGNNVANNCRITNCVIEAFNPADRSTRNAWVTLYGRNNRFDHNSLIGKLNAEATLIVQLNEERSQQNNHLIDHNYFGARPNYGSNGAETIRVGNSAYSLTTSGTQIMDNWFEHCDGEVEHVSIKSCDNLIARNVFYECAGELVLRHGNRNTVEENVFIGNRKPHTGGIRVVNADQIIRNNYLEGLTGKRFYAALAVMNAVHNPLPNRYHQVENMLVENNIFVRCDHIEIGVGADFERTMAPVGSVIKNNLFYYPEKANVFEIHTNINGIKFEGNRAVAGPSAKPFSGLQYIEQEVAPTYQLPVKKEMCGAAWFKNDVDKQHYAEGQTLHVPSGQNTLIDAIQKANSRDILVLANNTEYLIDQPIIINKPITIKADKTDSGLPTLKYNGTKSGQPMITIVDGGLPRIDGLIFDGTAFEGKARANAGISPAKVMQGSYSAHITNCTFKHFEESSFAGFRALKNSFADTLSFSKCRFHDISGEGVGLGAEKNDDGKYSAENILINDCEFFKILNAAINIYRGGNDESTTGPSLQINNCKFTDCSNQERGAALRLIGVQTASLEYLSFLNSGRGGAAIKFDECRWDDIYLNNIMYMNSGELRMNRLYKMN